MHATMEDNSQKRRGGLKVGITSAPTLLVMVKCTVLFSLQKLVTFWMLPNVTFFSVNLVLCAA